MCEQDNSYDYGDAEGESVKESLAALLKTGFFRWSGHFRAGRPIFVPTALAYLVSSGSVGAACAHLGEAPSIDDYLDGWLVGDADALELIAPDLAADPGACDRTFPSKCEAFKIGLLLGARGVSEDKRLPTEDTQLTILDRQAPDSGDRGL